MKKQRFISILLCLVLIVNLSITYVYATSPVVNSPGNVFVNENYAVYSYDDDQYRFNIFLDASISSGSFAVVYKSNDNLMYEHIFNIPSNSIDFYSTSFWNNLIADCFENTQLENAINIDNAVALLDESQNANTRAVTNDPFEDDFLDWLEIKHGPARQDSYVCGSTVRGITFLQYETVEYQVTKSNAYTVMQAISVAGLITSVIGFVASPGLVAALGILFSGIPLISAGTQIATYTLSVYWTKYVTAKDGKIKHSFTTKCIRYDGFVSGSDYVVNEDEPFIACDPSRAYFESNADQFNAAYNSYMGIY